MSVCYASEVSVDLPPEQRLLELVQVRLILPSERERFDQLIQRHHYLGNANAIGQVLRYVAEYDGKWVAVLTFCSAALHLKPRDRFLQWDAREVPQRRHLIAQNSRFLILPSTGRWPNLASKILKLVCQGLCEDWNQRFGHPVLLVETFVDPQRFRGTCYRAAGWEALGRTQGFRRRDQDYYQNTKHPKELWIRPLVRNALKELRAKQLPPELLVGAPEPPPPPPIVETRQMDEFYEFIRPRLSDPRKAKGVRYPIASIVSLAVLAIASGCQGPHAIAKFAESLNHGQRRRLRCRHRKNSPRLFDVPCERTFDRLLKVIDSEQLKEACAGWMATLDPRALKVLHFDGKVLKNTDPSPARLHKDRQLAQAAQRIDTPAEDQKPKANKALTLVNFQTPEQRMVDQIAVPCDTNEEAAVAAHLPKMDLKGVCVIADAAHTVKANCHQLTQVQGADYILFLKGNQPTAFAKAKSLLGGDIPPSGRNTGQGTRPD